MTARTPDSAQTLDRGLRLLHLVAESPGLTVTEAANRLGVGRTVVYRLVSALVDHTMVRRDAAGRLRLGVGLLQLARRARPLVADAARPALRRLAEAVGATAHLTVAEDAEATALVVVEPSWTALHVAYRSGTRHPLARGAAGQAILAGRRGETGPVVTAGELQAEAYGIAVPVLGVEGLEASVGVVALGPLDPATAGPAVRSAAEAITTALG
ncbi:IclR family transcriptional regulator [Pilimelia columellifera]|uniref:Helix-turn-helix domain-containing protein n=1 Tax=Pilimelia columellifera subsp. columellifera TaxID=706583 RepID=A0ABN3NRJ6_9ACTN